jgi:hypothetical protein
VAADETIDDRLSDTAALGDGILCLPTVSHGLPKLIDDVSFLRQVLFETADPAEQVIEP